MNKQNKPINCAEHIVSACNTLDVSLATVKTMFQNREQDEVSYSRKDEKDYLLEVRLESVTLTCLFNENQICEGVFLFLDHEADIFRYIEYCNQAYPYDMILKGWIENNCFIQLNTENKECSLLIISIQQKEES